MSNNEPAAPAQKQQFFGLWSDYHQGLAALILGTLMFSTKGILIKLAYEYGVTPTALMTMRMLIALPFYLWVLLHQFSKGGLKDLSRKQVFHCCALGVMGYYLASWLDLRACK